MALITGLNSDYNSEYTTFTEENPRNWAVGGEDLERAAAHVDGWLASHTFNTKIAQYVFFINFGILGAVGETEATFKSNYLYVIDAMQAKFPGCHIFLTLPSAKDSPRGALVKPWIEYVIAARTNVYVGDNEAVWAENGDNYATMYYDGLHYSAAGHAQKPLELRARLLAVLGY